MGEIQEIDKVDDILRKTDDGDNLSQRDLKLLEHALNGFLNAAGLERLNQLHEDVVSGKYHNTDNDNIEDERCSPFAYAMIEALFGDDE